MINKTELNKLRSQIDKNKTYIDGLDNIKADDDKKHSMALSMSVLMEHFGINQKDAYDSVTDDGGDKKIDAFFYSDDDDEFTELVIVQSKYKKTDGDTGTFTEDEIKLCIDSCKRFLTGNDFSTANDVLKMRMKSYRDLLKDNNCPAISIKLIFATNGIICKEHRSLPEVISCLDANIFVSFADATSFSNAPVFDKGELNVNLKSPEDKTDSIFSIGDETYSGMTVSCNIQELMEFYKNTGERSLLSSNVRYSIKRSEVNKEIHRSFIEDPKRFCYLNNGITIICSHHECKPTGHGFTRVELRNPSIVNGGQTVATLYQIYLTSLEKFRSQFENAKILLRIYKVPREYAIKIAKATNLQNPINIVDLFSNDLNQEKAKQFFSARGVGLITKLGEDITHYDDTITNEHILQVYASLYGNEPEKAKVSKATIFRKYSGMVFSDSIDDILCKKLLRCYQISKFIQSNDAFDKALIQNAFYSIIYAMKKLNPHIENENIPEDGIQPLFKQAFIDVMVHIKKVISAKQAGLKDKFSMNNLFKGNEIKDLIDLSIENN